MRYLHYQYLLVLFIRFPRVRHRLWKYQYRHAMRKARRRSPEAILLRFFIEEYPDSLIILTQETWSKRLGRPIPKDEAIDIIRSFRNFISLVKEVKNAQRPQS